MKNHFYLICTTNDVHWGIIENARFKPNTGEYLASLILAIKCCNYVEYVNCGVTYRVIRSSNLKDYKLNN